MAELVLIKAIVGSRAATVLCPNCGRISRQILSKSYDESTKAELLREYECPLCKNTYRECNSALVNNWTSAVLRYNRDADAYNQSVRENYWIKQNSKPKTTSNSTTMTTPKPAVPTERTGIQSLISVLEQHTDQAKTSLPVEKPAATNGKASKIMAPSESELPAYPAVESGNSLPVITSAAPSSATDVLMDEALSRKTARWKRELLDTSKRNRMINYRETSRATLKILEPDAATLFNKLAFSEKPLTFQKPINKDTDLRTYSMIALMETLSYSLNVQVGDIKTSGTIIERERTLKNLRSKAKLAQDEQGTNTLYLCFGFIYWREHERESSPWLKAPLLMMPVSLGLKSLNAPYTLSRYDDEIEVNPTLDYLFNAEYHIDLPTFELKNRDSFANYLAQIEEIVDKRGWKVVPEVSLGLLSFLKISMYHDLNNNQSLMMNHPVLRAMAGDRTAIGELPAAANNFDFDSVKPTEWHEVVDSDSSQEEAILLSKLGVSFVMQGPPGTGKSQTITNIIAEALADGKKVLFVSEKAAALQVVLKRLADVGLDDFCLSLHDYKANKKEIIDSIGSNLDLEEEYIDSSLISELTALFHDRTFLNAYADELHKEIQPLGLSVYEVFGKLLKLSTAPSVEFTIDGLEKITKEQYASIMYCVSAFEKALRNMGGPLSSNPWYGTKATSSGQVYKNTLLHETNSLSELLRKAKALVEELDNVASTGLTDTFANTQKYLSFIRLLNTSTAEMRPIWFKPGVLVQAQKECIDAEEHAIKLSNALESICANWDKSILEVDEDTVCVFLRGDYSWLYDKSSGDTLENELSKHIEHAVSIKANIGDLLLAFHEALTLIHYTADDTFENIRMVAKVLALIAEAPYMEASWFDLRKNAEMVPLILQAREHSNIIERISSELLETWEPSALEIDADGMLSRFKTEYVGLFHKMKANYKEDIKTLRLHAKTVGAKLEEPDIISFLQKVREINNEKAWFSQNRDALERALGHHFHGEKTDWDRVRASMAAALQITDQFPYDSISQDTIEALRKITESLQLSGNARRLMEVLCEGTIDSLAQSLSQCKYISSDVESQNLTKDIIPEIDAFVEVCTQHSQHISTLLAAKHEKSLSYSEITELLSQVGIVKTERQWFDIHSYALRASIDELYVGPETNWTAVLDGVRTVQKVADLFNGSVPESVITFACSNDRNGVSLQEPAEKLGALLAEIEPRLRFYSEQFDVCDMFEMEMDKVAAHYDAAVADFTNLSKWLDYVETKKDCDEQGISNFTEKIATMDNAIAGVVDAFERGFYSNWLLAQLDGVPSVQGFRRRIQDQRVEHFAKLDAKQYVIARKRIRSKIIQTYPDLNRVARAGSELGILRHEMDKKKRVMPIRKLFKSIPNLLLTLKPCLMMSPLSVAYFLDANAYRFDMVIFDEASQIFPQDAIGAIFRAKQVIIAGDTKQLPPTNFFATSTSNNSEDYDDEDASEDEIYDSILEETATVLPNRTLLWHYRSKHEHLIAFSNQEIYRNNLVTFPSSNESAPDTGVEFVYVEDGYFERGGRNCNVLEARRCVDLVKDHIERHPERSLGIIAFSEKQQQAIALEIQRFRERNPEYEEFFAEGKDDEFFIKNLENVQGDERDTIIFSVGYARTKEQRANNRPMSMLFGPLGKSGGERRLNVAITRAKINIKLVSSILPSDIDLSRTESEGVKMLRSYIEFAMNGEVSLSSARKTMKPDDFANAIAQFITNHGYQVSQHIGCSGYKIDIAIRHPSDTIEQYIAGIECDGPSYASARTARDRDRLRGTVLKNMGWNMYRVWSAEWYKNPEVEGKKLLDFITKASRDCEEKIRQQEEERRNAEEAKRIADEKKRAALEAEAQKKQREHEEAEARRKAEREAAALKKKQEAEKKAAKEKADQEAARKKEAEQKATEERRRKEAELLKMRTDLSWVKVGVKVTHSKFGDGVIRELAKDQIKIGFRTGDRVFMYPSVFQNGLLVKYAVPEKPMQEGPAWVKVGASVAHKVYGTGLVDRIQDSHIVIKFGNIEKTFSYPGAFRDGYLFQVKGQESQRAQNATLPSSVKYAPGNEPESIRKRLDRLFAKLDSAYPDKIISGLHKDHKKWGESVTELYRLLGYPDGNSFLTAYGYTQANSVGGRPAGDPMEVVLELKKRYPNGPTCSTLLELIEENPDLSSKFSNLRSRSEKFFGMTLAKYFVQEGLLLEN